MHKLIRKGMAEVTLPIVLGLTIFCAIANGNDEEKKIVVEDKTPPVISNVKVFNITDSGAEFTWNTDESAKGEIIWGITEDMKNAKWIMHEEFTKSHHFKVTDLEHSTSYYYWTASGDAKNNWIISEPSTFKTQAK